MGKITDLIGKANPMKLLKGKPFSAIFLLSIADQFATTSMEELNEAIDHTGIQLDYKGNGTNAGLIFIHSIKPNRKSDDAIILYDKAKQIGYAIYIMPKIAYRYTIYNKAGQVTATVIHAAGLDSAVIQIRGSENFYKIEGEIL